MPIEMLLQIVNLLLANLFAYQLGAPTTVSALMTVHILIATAAAYRNGKKGG